MDQAAATKGTKQRILDAALELFSTYGYDAVSVERIARQVGIKAPSLYKHFKSKQDIFDSIVAEMDRAHEDQAAQLHLNLGSAENDVTALVSMSEEELSDTVFNMVRFAACDQRYGAFRRMLTIEQYHRHDLAERYADRYLQRYLDYHAKVFSALMASGVLRDGDPEMVALQYFAPLVTFVGALDRHPERSEEVRGLVSRHIHQFRATYEVG